MTEEFAIASFVKLNDSERLARKSFEQMKSGLSFQTSKESKYGFNIHKDVNYELSYVHRKKIVRSGIFKFLVDAFNVFVKGNAIAKNPYSVSKKATTIAPAKVDINKYGYAVVNTSDMALAGEGMVAHLFVDPEGRPRLSDGKAGRLWPSLSPGGCGLAQARYAKPSGGLP